jgi:hypothetical protein
MSRVSMCMSHVNFYRVEQQNNTIECSVFCIVISHLRGTQCATEMKHEKFCKSQSGCECAYGLCHISSGSSFTCATSLYLTLITVSYTG